MADRPKTPARFLLLGSASPDLIRGAAESLAGRVTFVYLRGFDVTEVGAEHTEQLWHRGGFPRAFLAEEDASGYAWRQDFIETFLSRDAARFGITPCLLPQCFLFFCPPSFCPPHSRWSGGENSKELLHARPF